MRFTEKIMRFVEKTDLSCDDNKLSRLQSLKSYAIKRKEIKTEAGEALWSFEIYVKIFSAKICGCLLNKEHIVEKRNYSPQGNDRFRANVDTAVSLPNNH